MPIAEITVAITVTGNENYIAAAVPNFNFKPYLPLAAKARGHIVTIGAIFHLHLEGNTPGIGPFGNNVSENIAGTQNL